MKYINIRFFLIIMAIIITSCNTNTNQNISQKLIPNIINPVILSAGENTVFLDNFLINTSVIDSVQIENDIPYSLSSDKRILTFFADEKINALTELKIFADGEPYTVLLQRTRKISHKIYFDSGDKKYNTVQLAGSLNDWNPENTQFEFKNGKWECSILLNPGKYHYQIVVDGEWILDPANKTIEDNNLGGFNSVLRIGDEIYNKLPFIEISSISKDEFLVESRNDYTEIFVMWQNYRLQTTKKSPHTYSIPQEAANIKRSWISIKSYNNYGLSNDILVPLEYGKIVQSMDNIDRFDKESSVLYFMMVDRFSNGNKLNDHKVDDPEVHEKANYFGGDIAGIHKKLKEGYFKELGINTIWLSPITQNTWGSFTEFPEPHRKFTGYHGYWPISLTTVDKRFGTEKELQLLVDDAHKNGINIILDFVSNHVHQECKLFTDHPDWATKIDLPDGSKNIRQWDSQRLTTWFDTFLPSWNFEIPEVNDYVSDSALFWIKKYDIDGFRHDATKHIPQKFWRTLTEKLKREVTLPEDKRLLQIGETFGSRELIGSYVGSGMLDGQFDFNLYFDARSVFALDNESFKKLNNSIKESLSYYGHHHLMGNITGNHDMARFISYAGEALGFDEESQEAGWSRDIKVENPIGYKKLSMLIAFNMTIPGIPVIYYGDEYGMPGAGDPDNRRQMQFDSLSTEESNTREVTKKLIEIKRNSVALNFGSFEDLYVSDTEYIYCRKYFDNIVIVAMNKSSESAEIEIVNPTGNDKNSFIAHFKNDFSVNAEKIKISIPPYSFEILERSR